MAKTTAAKKTYNKKYYKKNKEEIIDSVQAKQKGNRKEYNKDKREYYANNEDYRKYKRRYSKEYKKQVENLNCNYDSMCNYLKEQGLPLEKINKIISIEGENL